MLGIKNTRLDPILLKILPSGIAVYQSPFKDVFGSRIIFGGPHKSFKNKSAEIMTSNAVFLVQAAENEVYDVQEQDELVLMNVFPSVPCPGKGAAEELLIDLDDEQGFRFQSHLKQEGYLETLLDISVPEINKPILQPRVKNMDMETSLLDISSPEISAPVLQPRVNSMDTRKPEKNRTRDGSGFRISDTLMGQNETKGNGLNDIEHL